MSRESKNRSRGPDRPQSSFCLHQSRVPDHADHARFVDETPDELGLMRQVRVQDLDGRPLPDFRVNRLEDRSHPAFAELADDVVVSPTTLQLTSPCAAEPCARF